MEVRDRIDTILADDSLNDESSALDKTEAIEALIGECGWEAVRDQMMAVLQDERRAKHWWTAAHVFWGAVLDGRELPADELIAWLYHRFDPDGQAEDNEIWSIASKLREVGYLSDYNPLQAPRVVLHLEAIRGRAKPGDGADDGA